MSESARDYKDGHSLVWDENAKFRQQKWPDLKKRIDSTQGGVGVIADDFLEMLGYRSAPLRQKAQTLRDAFADLTRDATASEDLDLLADILAYMLREPWSANLEGAWFIYYLEEQGSRDIDVVRAAGVINRLHSRHPYAAQVLGETLSSYVHGANEELVIDLILKTDRLSADVIDSLRNARLHPPRVGKRHLISYPHLFVSYSRADLERTRSVRSQLHNDGFTTWIDERLEPGTPDWQEAIETAIRESGGVVVLLTPAAKNSTWVDQEIDLAVRFGKRLFPVLVTGDDTTAVPPKLAKIQRVDITNNRLDELVALGGAIRRHLSSHARQSAGDTE